MYLYNNTPGKAIVNAAANITYRPLYFNKGRSTYNGRLSDLSFYIDSQISVHRKLTK